MVGFLKRLFGSGAALTRPGAPPVEVPRTRGTNVFDLPPLLLAGDPLDRFGFEVVGESYRQDALRSLVAAAPTDKFKRYRVEVMSGLVPEPSNPEDPNAIAIYIARRHVGYVPREAARYVHEPIARVVANGNLPTARAVIVGSADRSMNLGVWLDLDDSVVPSTPDVEAELLRAGHPTQRPWTGERESPRAPVGMHAGKHYTAWVDDVKALKRHGAYAEAKVLLGDLIGAVERECESARFDPAPWYYEQQAIVCRKLKDYDGEVAVIDRYLDVASRLGNHPPNPLMVERRAKAVALRAKHLAP
ncbi:MAG: hypothetical protein IT299_00410 [Dehalococcoidia bacterium]|nr:hypothetical protein [Dehalococcoidia bacterium]